MNYNSVKEKNIFLYKRQKKQKEKKKKKKREGDMLSIQMAKVWQLATYNINLSNMSCCFIVWPPAK